MSDRVYIFDTTLSGDGEQSPGATMNAKEKVRIANRLEALGVGYYGSWLSRSFRRRFFSCPGCGGSLPEIQRGWPGPDFQE